MGDSKMLLKLLILHLQADAPSAPVLKIILAAEAARPRVSQGGLFSPISPDPEKVELTVARLAKLVGDANIGSPELLDTHRPEGFRMRRFVPNRDSAETRRPIRRSPGDKTRRRQGETREFDPKRLQNCVSGFPAGAAGKSRSSPRLPHARGFSRHSRPSRCGFRTLAWFGRLVERRRLAKR